MIYVEDQTIKLNGVVLPGLVKSIEVTESAKVDEQEVAEVRHPPLDLPKARAERSAAYPHCQRGHSSPRHREGHLQEAHPQGREQERTAYRLP